MAAMTGIFVENGLIWFGIAFCVSQSAMFSGLNLAFFSLSRLRLQVEVASGNRAAARVRDMRRDANFLLTTVLWGNVGINVLLTLLSESVLAGVGAFLFSTVIITFLGEIVPQAYFSRHALRIAARLAPVLRLYQFLLYPLAKPTALMLDLWLGREGIVYFREHELRALIREHIEASEAEIDSLEGLGALNFLAIDDLAVTQEGEPLDPRSVIRMPFEAGLPRFPAISPSPKDGFLQRIQASGKKWVVLTDDADQPQFVIDSHEFLRVALFDPQHFDPRVHCRRPIVVHDPAQRLGKTLARFVEAHDRREPAGFDDNVILVWTENWRAIITASDILHRLMSTHTGPLATQ
jgi:metal transporter CNNM